MHRINLKNAILLSIALHLFFVGSTWFFDQFKPLSPAPAAITFEIIEPTETQTTANPLKKVTPTQAQQIVDQKTESSQKPVDTRFMSEKDQVVEKQTVAKNRGEFKNAQSEKKVGPRGVSQAKPADKEPPQEPALKDLFAQYDPAEGMKRQQEKYRPQTAGENGQDGKGEVSQTQDYIKDVDQGLQTILNTREFKYYSYYSRIRKQLAQHWEGEVRERLSKLFREGRSPAATNQDRITKVIVVLNSAGTLVRVQLIADSGVRDLDEAAIEAFRAAAPFPNPPAGIIEADGTVKIRWDFVLES